MLQGFGFKIPYHLVKTIIWYKPTVLFPSYVLNYLCFGPEVIPIVWHSICLICFRFSAVCLKPWERCLEGGWIGRSTNVTFLYFPFQKSIHPSLTEMKLQEQRLSSLCKFMCVFWDPVSSGERNVAVVQASNHEILVLLSSMEKLPLTLVGLGFYSQPSCFQLHCFGMLQYKTKISCQTFISFPKAFFSSWLCLRNIDMVFDNIAIKA